MKRQLAWGLIGFASLLAAGCGGGSGSSGGGGSSTPTVSSTGQFRLAFSGGTIPGVKHAYVTITKVVLNEDIDRAWSPSDTTWKTVTLGLPVTIDLAAGNGFIVGSESATASVPIGTYQQIRLILAGHDAPLLATKLGQQVGLAFNAQIEYEDGSKIVPLELPNLQAGFRLDRGVSITASAVGGVTAHIDLDRNLVRFNGGYADRDAATLRMRSFSTRSGADGGVIFGEIDPTLLCDSPTATPAAPCARDVTVSLYQPSLDGLFSRFNNLYTVKVNPYVSTSTGLKPDGTFVLGPLNPEADESRNYDVIIRGQGMRTMVIRSVPLKSLSDGLFNATDVANWAGAIGTYIGKTWTTADGKNVYRSYIRPILIGASEVESQASVAAPQTPWSSRLILGMQLAGTSRYELIAANTDPFTGLMRQPMRLPKGDPFVATFAAIINEDHSTATASEPIFNSTFVADGTSTLVPMALGRYYDEGAVDAAHPVADTDTTFAPVPLAFKSGVATAAVTVTASGLPTTGWNQAYLVVSDVGGIVYTEDVTASISGGGLTKTLSLPKGTNSYGYATGVYAFAIRTRLVGGTDSDTHWYRSGAQLDLRDGTANSITIP
ncbi:MAG: DUF4382 domain-containing protein [Acidobacteriota bacterium]